MQVAPSIFKAYDIRGIVPSTVDESVAEALGLAFGTEARRLGEHTVAVGRDGRISGPALSAALIRGLVAAGVDVIEARISHLAYAPEIASAMLQRQQAQAVIAARTKIVEGAVTMVDMALKHLEKDNIVHLDDERRAAMVSNLLVVLCSGGHTQPVVNAGTLYN